LVHPTQVKQSKKVDLNSQVGALIRKLREAKGLSQEDLADQADLDRTYISGVERCKRNLTIKTLSKIIPLICDSESDFFRHLAKELADA